MQPYAVLLLELADDSAEINVLRGLEVAGALAAGEVELHRDRVQAQPVAGGDLPHLFEHFAAPPLAFGGAVAVAAGCLADDRADAPGRAARRRIFAVRHGHDARQLLAARCLDDDVIAGEKLLRRGAVVIDARGFAEAHADDYSLSFPLLLGRLLLAG